VVSRQVGPHDDGGVAPCEPAEGVFHAGGGRLDRAPAGVPVGHVGRKILPDAEHDGDPVRLGDSREGQRERVGPEDPHDVDVGQRGAERRHRTGERPADRAHVVRSVVPGQRPEVDVGPDGVGLPRRGRIGRPSRTMPSEASATALRYWTKLRCVETPSASRTKRWSM